MTANTETANTFEAGGHVWTPKFTTPVIMRTCRALGLSVEGLTENAIGKINIADLIRVLFFSVAHEAEKRGVDEDAFLESIPPDELMAAFQVLFATVQKSFPQVDLSGIGTGGSESGGGEEPSPLP